jgi:hypothetical protein
MLRWYLVTQSISGAIVSRFPVSIAPSTRRHICITRPVTGSSPLLSVKSLALVRYSYWICSALIWRPSASRTRLRPVMSWLTSRIARIGLSSVRSGMIVPASIIRSTRPVAPTLSSIVVSLMLESPTVTRRRRNRAASAYGLSSVSMTARDPVLDGDATSRMWPARWLRQ